MVDIDLLAHLYCFTSVLMIAGLWRAKRIGDSQGSGESNAVQRKLIAKASSLFRSNHPALGDYYHRNKYGYYYH